MANPHTKWAEFALTSGLRLAGIVLLAFLVNRILKAVTNRLIKPASAETRVALMREQQTRTLAGILYSAGTALILAVALLTALPEFGINVTPIAALAGLASVALGFGAQNLVSDLINGFFIVFEDQYVVGDVVRIGDTVGRVEHLTLRRTVLRDQQGALLSIPNGTIRQVGNLSRDWAQVFVDVTVTSDDSVDAALAELEKIAGELRADAAWSAALVEGPRVLGVESLSLAGPMLRMQVRTAPNRQHDVARELRRRIKARFEQKKLGLAGVQRVQLVGDSSAPTASREPNPELQSSSS
jgi:small conductance mechanosensitive channel